MAQLRSEYEMTRNQLIAAKAMEARLIAERDDKSVITFDQMYEPESPRGIEARAGETEVFNSRRVRATERTSPMRKDASTGCHPSVGTVRANDSGLRTPVTSAASRSSPWSLNKWSAADSSLSAKQAAS